MDFGPVQTMARINFATKVPARLILGKNNVNVSTFFVSFFIPLSISLSLSLLLTILILLPWYHQWRSWGVLTTPEINNNGGP